jgi:hypothetical protein
MFYTLSAPMAADATVDTTAEERCFLCGPCLDIISRTISGVSSAEFSTVERSEMVSSQVRGLLQFGRCELLLLEAGR